MSKPALIIIDLQNDYFPHGLFPLANTESTLQHVLQAIEYAQERHIPIIHVQHVADPNAGIAPFFNQGSEGVKIHPDILAAAPDAPIIIKHYADAFVETDLQETLDQLNINELILCGMMTQNCVTFTALAPQAESYHNVTVLSDATTTVSEILHLIALNALSTRITLKTVTAYFSD
ncbi:MULTISPECIES: cysteine hydrolase family protein [unclassified Acinetobacter]|uniref:cysteine hydrolase family protein n=1 Tax=unclassified Acinetobacter TaxID=196816 RepID=UPI0029352908|nr:MULTISPECIES: cysteine hydrolase family protein [unclassified Acinetobacter]WOE33261.1 cysteine hydrolase family protein [Acinetobacter sp. SAAs470]WOE36958.1 cysteine hydrolase family protein [Acinetobacter sp. SAAs474]